MIPCDTRWNSKYDAIKQIHTLKDKINMYIDELQKSIQRAAHLQKLTSDDWTIIGAYLKVMEPVAVSLDKLQGEKNGNQGFILPTVKTMRFNIEKVDGGNCTKSFKQTMLDVVDRRFRKFYKMDETNRELIVATMSTPRFKNGFIENDYEADNARKMLIDECIKLTPNEMETDGEEATATTSTDDDYFLSFGTRRYGRRNSIEQTVEQEVDRYSNDRRKENIMLTDYPIISTVFRKFNTTLASSGAVERVFSQTSLILTPRRNRISAQNFEFTLLLKYNKRYMF